MIHAGGIYTGEEDAISNPPRSTQSMGEKEKERMPAEYVREQNAVEHRYIRAYGRVS